MATDAQTERPKPLTVVLVHPGATDFDEQRRIKGTLDLPLNANGQQQAARTAAELDELPIRAVYSAPDQACHQTAVRLAQDRARRVKVVSGLRGIDHGLWHGKSIEEVRQRQPRMYRLAAECPESICPPDGEPFANAQRRVAAALAKLLRKHHDGMIAIVATGPVAWLIRRCLQPGCAADLWECECERGGWEAIDSAPQTVHCEKFE